jgi:hypothetical protein
MSFDIDRPGRRDEGVKTVDCNTIFDLKGGLELLCSENRVFWEVQKDDQVQSKRIVKGDYDGANALLTPASRV